MKPEPSMPTHPRARNNKKLLNQTWKEIRLIAQVDPDEAYKRIDDMLPHLDEYTAGPDIWFNFAAIAGRVDHDRAQYEVVDAGLREHPNDVDLLCSQFQQFYAKSDMYYSAQAAKDRWEYLCKLPIDQSGPAWRFWVYGATYHSLELKDTKTAEELLKRGLSYVRRDSIMDILRAFRGVLLLGPPANLVKFDDLAAEQERLFNTVESQFLLGVQMGVDNSYVLAMDLAEMYQERAGVTKQSAPSQTNLSEKQRNYLDKALEYLALAERLYTADSNHPVYEIYVAQARVLMSLKEYSKVVNILESIPQFMQRDLSVAAMLKLARRSIGLSDEVESVESGAVSREQIAQIEQNVLQSLFGNDGKGLEQLLRQNRNVLATVINVLQRLGGDE
jgi:hypothetical protein